MSFIAHHLCCCSHWSCTRVLLSLLQAQSFSDLLKPDENNIVNLSSHILTPDQAALLKKGLNFCPTPGEPDLSIIRQDLEKFHLGSLRKSFFDRNEDLTLNSTQNDSQSSTDITSDTNTPTPFSHPKFKHKSGWRPPGHPAIHTMISLNEEALRTFPCRAPHNQNLTLGEKQALAELKELSEIIIKPADKGSAVVLLDRDDYITEAYRQLNDTTFYTKTDIDLTTSHNDRIIKFLDNLHLKGEIHSKCRDYLCIQEPRTAQFYLLPKIHKGKIPPPGRPIVSANECPTERISAFVDFFLKPMVLDIKSYLKDTTHFLNVLDTLGTLPPNCHLVTLDVTSLYTNIPNLEGKRAVAQSLNRYRNGESLPTNTSLIRLLDMVLTMNNFDFNGDHFLQTSGTAMGSRVSVNYSNIFMSEWENKHVYTRHKQPLLWKRFIDDVFCIWQHSYEDLISFISHLNDCHPSIKFTADISREKVHFLDTTVILNDDNTITTDLYCKPTDTHNYLMYSSAHPTKCKDSIPYSQFLRIRRICSNIEDFDKHAITLATHFIRRGYPLQVIDESIINARRKDRHSLLNPIRDTGDQNQDRVFLISTYQPGFTALKDTVNLNWELLNLHPDTVPLYNCTIVHGYRRNHNLRDLLVHSRLDQRQPNDNKIDNQCHNVRCRICPKLNLSGKITSHITKREYSSKHNVSCKSSNVIYCVSCTRCGLQYVGQTKRSANARLSEHLGYIRQKKTEQSTGEHFTRSDHDGENDVSFHIVDFAQHHPDSIRARNHRDLLERKWIFRLRTLTPQGLNNLD